MEDYAALTCAEAYVVAPIARATSICRRRTEDESYYSSRISVLEIDIGYVSLRHGCRENRKEARVALGADKGGRYGNTLS